MKKVIVLLAILAGCTASISALAYTSSDCENAKELGYQNIINYQDSCRDYGLDRTATRQEAAAITLKIGEACGTIYNIPPTGQYYCNNIFADVGYRNPNNWVCRVIETLDRENILPESDYNSFGDRYFRPLKSITRADALSMILRGAGIDYENSSYDSWRFTSSVPTKYRSLVQYAYDNDIISSIGSFGASTSAYRRDIFNYAAKIIDLCGNNPYGNNYNYNYNYNYGYGNCGVGQYYSGNTCYSCGSLPTNASYTRRGSCDWQCTSGYYKSGNTCVYSGYGYQYGNCGVGQYWAGNMCLGCTTKSSYGYYTKAGTCDWECTTGYYKSGNICVSNYNTSCGTGQYYQNGRCYSCGTIPYNATYNYSGSCEWTCNNGYYRSGDSCVNSNNYNYNCGVGQYTFNGTCYSCGSLPYNAFYVSSGTSCDWQCNPGYTRNSYNNTCDYTGGGYYYGGENCNTPIATDAHYTNGNCWKCNDGFVQVNNLCVWWGRG